MEKVIRKIRRNILLIYILYLIILGSFAYFYYSGGNIERILPAFLFLFSAILLGTGILIQVQLRNLLREESMLYDKLTGLYKKEVIEEMLLRQIELARRTGKDLSVLLIDVDDFRKVSRILGRGVADKMLKDLGFLIRKNLRKSDIAGRWSSDQFIVILPETSLEGAEKVAKKFQWKVKDFFEGNYNYPLTISVGITKYENMDSVEKIIYKLENAVWQAKVNGKNRMEKFLLHELTKKSNRVVKEKL
ncbi:GGDEF domain-containing protein [Aquifex sp.]